MYVKRGQLAGVPPFDPAMIVRGWVNFSGVAGAILGSHNVTSVSRSSTGRYVVTWAVALVASAYSQLVALAPTDSGGVVIHAMFDTTAGGEPLLTTSSAIMTESGTADGVADTPLLTATLIGPR